MRCCDGLVRLERRLALTVKRLQYNAVSSPGSAAQPWPLLGVMGGCARCCTEALAEHRQADLAIRLPRGLSVVQQPARASNKITTVDIVIPQLPGHLSLFRVPVPGDRLRLHAVPGTGYPARALGPGTGTRRVLDKNIRLKRRTEFSFQKLDLSFKKGSGSNL